ncbi:hypothetical protein B4168_1535 [Anoxybacillus flavithermus]|nr:hypothetical protein B4168_1535 [Anoxybacillus flavithermus]OAO84190.1 hypothetical protein GT23_3725 [Parageobacillus thermoglucosidasius]
MFLYILHSGEVVFYNESIRNGKRGDETCVESGSSYVRQENWRK